MRKTALLQILNFAKTRPTILHIVPWVKLIFRSSFTLIVEVYRVVCLDAEFFFLLLDHTAEFPVHP